MLVFNSILIVKNRTYNKKYVYKKLRTQYYYKFIPEFFLPAHIQLFIFRYLFLKQFFFLNSLYLCRIETFRKTMKKLILRYFYTRKIHYYFFKDLDINFQKLISSDCIVDLDIKHPKYFNIVDFLYYEFILL